MSRRCAICSHPQRLEIEREIIRGATRASVSRKYGMSTTAVYRHETKHIPQLLVKARDVATIASADILIAELKGLKDTAEEIMVQCKEDKNYRASLYAIQQLKGLIELTAKLCGELKTTHTSIVVNAEWITLKTVIFGVLEDFPDAKHALIEALRQSGAE